MNIIKYVHLKYSQWVVLTLGGCSKKAEEEKLDKDFVLTFTKASTMKWMHESQKDNEQGGQTGKGTSKWRERKWGE